MPKSFDEQKFGLLLILPSFILLGLVALYPILRNLILSFTENDQFIGIKNFILLFQDERFKSSLFNTLLFCLISVPLQLFLGLVFALILQQRFFTRGFVRTSVFLPWALPTAVMAVAWKWIFNDTYGVFNDILLRLQIIKEPLAWLGKPDLAFFCIILAEVWKCTPFVTVILLAGLQSIPPELYEAISVDGANTLQRFRLITLPLLRPFLLVALVFRTIQALGVFDSIWVLTGGGPGGSTEPISLYVYDTVFRYLKFSYGSTMVIFSFILSLIFVFIFYKFWGDRQIEY
ncbi:MAG: sugar ABC transporter permease [Candidatus Omnitrophota bacterium]|nr:MAG: sugar ABC transporter permease [Candidatus Omnitrophota bacterium]RKY34610.1 MAG: sugar ABC transporter permease [Candidatus Omnitrophota bacterium]RKY44729.1 MAG: sugar ABC transporter permease [Candidatus Omnitrophota bacterium]